MRLRRTDDKEKLIQEADEADFLSFCADRKINAQKLPMVKGQSSADFELATNSSKLFVELKSRFDDKTYDTLIDFISTELSHIPAAFDYSIQIDYRHRMYSPHIIRPCDIKQAVQNKIDSIDNDTVFPVEIEYPLYDEKISCEDEIEQLQRKLYDNVVISLENNNDEGIMRLYSRCGSSYVFDGKWICDRIEDAAVQLRNADYDASSPKGVFLINDTPHDWGYAEKLFPFYFPTNSITTVDDNRNLIVMDIKQENFLRSGNLTIVSFLGFLKRTGGRITELDLFLNPHAVNKLSLDIVKELHCFAHWVKPVNSMGRSLVIQSFRPDLNDGFR